MYKTSLEFLSIFPLLKKELLNYFYCSVPLSKKIIWSKEGGKETPSKTPFAYPKGCLWPTEKGCFWLASRDFTFCAPKKRVVSQSCAPFGCAFCAPRKVAFSTTFDFPVKDTKQYYREKPKKRKEKTFFILRSFININFNKRISSLFIYVQ